MSGQLLLDLGHRPALGREDFLVAESNRAAVAWIDAWPAWPAAGLVVWGPPQCGKTHLAEVWRTRSGAIRIDAVDLAGRSAPDVLGASATVVLEAADAARDERAFLHLYNLVAERAGHLLLTAREAPARWAVGLADLRSRLAALPAVELGAPDDQLIQAVLVKLFADRQLRVEPDVIAYLAARLERSLAAAAAAVREIDRAALAARRPVTVPLVRQALRLEQAPP